MSQSITRFAVLGFVLLSNISAPAGQTTQERNAERATLASAASPKSPGSAEVPYLLSIQVFNHAGVGTATLREAQQKTAAIFAKAGMDVEWRRFSRATGAEAPSAHDAAGRAVLPLNLILPAETAYPQMKKFLGLPKTAMGFALTQPEGKTHGETAYVFVNEVEELIEEEPFADLGVILGHMMAHELGHLLLGRGHSHSGLMSAGVAGRTLRLAGAGRLHFTRKQVKRIRRAVSERIGLTRAQVAAVAGQ